MRTVPDRQTTLEHLRAYARLQVRAGFLDSEALRADIADAIAVELPGTPDVELLAQRWLAEETAALAAEQQTWPATTDHDRLEDAFEDLAAAGVVVLRACDDHWSANAELRRLASLGRPPRGITWFTAPDVWHAIDHGMLELNVWHADTANVAPGDELLDTVVETLARHGLSAHFDEGRVEVGASWHRRIPVCVP